METAAGFAEAAWLVAMAASEGSGGPGGRAEESELNRVLYLLVIVMLSTIMEN